MSSSSPREEKLLCKYVGASNKESSIEMTLQSFSPLSKNSSRSSRLRDRHSFCWAIIDATCSTQVQRGCGTQYPLASRVWNMRRREQGNYGFYRYLAWARFTMIYRKRARLSRSWTLPFFHHHSPLIFLGICSGLSFQSRGVVTVQQGTIPNLMLSWLALLVGI